MDRAVSWRSLRRRVLAAVVAIVVAITAGMSGVAVAPGPAAGAGPVTALPSASHPPSDLWLSEYDMRAFVFYGASGSTGYSWRFSVRQAAEVVRISSTIILWPDRSDGQHDLVAGMPNLYVLAIAGTRAGRAVVTARLVPPGQDGSVETHVIHVVVAAWHPPAMAHRAITPGR